MQQNPEFILNVLAVKGRSQHKYPFPEGTDLFSLFQISLDNYFDIKFRLWEEFKLSIDHLESLLFYEYQILIDKLNKKIEEGNKKVYASTFDPKDENPILGPIETDKEWKIIEDILNKLQEGTTTNENNG